MITRLLNELYREEQASIPVRGVLEQAARALKDRTTRWRGLTFMDTVVGSVAVDRVVLRLSHRSLQNAFAPVFRGRFTAVRGSTCLTGRFALRRSVQTFVTAWLCLIGVFCIVGVVVGAGATVHRGTPSWIAVIAGALSALPGVALGLLGLAFMRM